VRRLAAVATGGLRGGAAGPSRRPAALCRRAGRAKRYKGKTCPYCRVPGTSTTRDHVVAREFFLIEDRDNLPVVPACRSCNKAKAALEHYALELMPFASRHPDVRRYNEEHLGPRLAKNQKLRASLVVHTEGTWEQHPAGFLVPTRSISIDRAKITALFAMVMTGLFSFHFQDVLDPDWYVDVAIINPDHEDKAIDSLLRYFQPGVLVEGNLGRGTFVYRGLRSREAPAMSLWQFTLFGRMQFGGAPQHPGRAFSKLSAVSRPRQEAVARVKASA
jgi:hypothetical protein